MKRLKEQQIGVAYQTSPGAFMASGALSIPNRQIDGWLKRKVRKILDTTFR
jgi:hypothetical protein